MKPTDPRSAFRLERILDMLLEKDLDQKQITERLCMAVPGQVKKYLEHLRKTRKAHVCDWREPGVNGHRWPVWRIGFAPSVPKPAPKTKAEIMRDYWKRQGRGSLNPVVMPACPFGALFALQERRA